MEKIAFIDLQFHKKTKSSDFFQDILKKEFDVDVFYENEIKKFIYVLVHPLILMAIISSLIIIGNFLI